jgi:hypothetical protein
VQNHDFMRTGQGTGRDQVAVVKRRDSIPWLTPVNTIELTPNLVNLAIGDKFQVVATVRDAHKNLLPPSNCRRRQRSRKHQHRKRTDLPLHLAPQRPQGSQTSSLRR